MRIVSWNCNGKFREKYNFIKKYKADIYVIQECENPNKYLKTINTKSFFTNFLWVGENQNKGLGVFCKKNIIIKENIWNKYCLREFLSCRINNEFDLLAVWAKKPYIEEYYFYQSINYPNYKENTLIIGGFNSNAKWDKKHYVRTHKNISNQLKQINLHSVYHYFFDEKEGEETRPTFFLYRNFDKPYHIDYAFIKKQKIINFEIGNLEFIKHSDHLPIILDFDDN